MTVPRLLSVMRFVLASRGVYFLAAFIFLLIFAAMSATGIELATAGKFWTDNLDPFVSMAVLIIALALWFREIRQDWRSSLPCRLTVVFQHDDGSGAREVMRCERAGLAGEGETRALAQQIGAQMIKGRLDFCAPSVTYGGWQIEDDNEGIVYRHYSVTLRLLELPAILADLPREKILVWRPPFNGDPKSEDRI